MRVSLTRAIAWGLGTALATWFGMSAAWATGETVSTWFKQSNINPVLVQGSDGTDAQPLKVTTTGAAVVGGAAADDAAASGNPVPIGCMYEDTIDSVDNNDIARVNCSANGSLYVAGTAADDAAASGNPVPIGCKYNTTENTVEDGDISYIGCDSRTRPMVVLCQKDTLRCATVPSTLGDDIAYQAALSVSAQNWIFDGTTYDRVRQVVNATDSTGTGIAAAGILAQGDDTSPVACTENQFCNLRLDKTDHSLLTGQYNGTTAEARRGNVDVTVLASAARTTTTASADLTNHNGTGLHLQIEVTAVTDTPSVVCTIQGKASVSAAYYTILATAAITTVSSNNYRVFPGSTVTANVSANDIIPRVWRVNCVHADSDSITYSISASVVG